MLQPSSDPAPATPPRRKSAPPPGSFTRSLSLSSSLNSIQDLLSSMPRAAASASAGLSPFSILSARRSRVALGKFGFANKGGLALELRLGRRPRESTSVLLLNLCFELVSTRLCAAFEPVF